MTDELTSTPQKKRLNLTALVSFLSGILTYVLLLFRSLIDLSLVAAILLAPITALLAIFTGSRAKRQIRKSDGLMSGKKLANTGLWLGWIYIILCVLVVVLALVIFGGIVNGISQLLASLGIG